EIDTLVSVFLLYTLLRFRQRGDSQVAELVASVLVQTLEEPNIPPPSKYTGNPDTCRNFCTQLQLIFDSQPRRFANESAKVAYIASLLEGPPLSLFNAAYEQRSPITQSASSLMAELKRIFDHPIRGAPSQQLPSEA
uniref:DUF4939 domain-containing protein n=1 Tax=Sphaeramia orbicularis TaxID=375764 RepID=A0A672YKE2_9TELE